MNVSLKQWHLEVLFLCFSPFLPPKNKNHVLSFVLVSGLCVINGTQ